MNKRAGAIPYYRENGKIYMLFFIPSDAAFGGTKYQISKGHLDEGETTTEAAVREAEEELGLKKSNIKTIKLGSIDEIEGMSKSYELYTYLIEVNNKNDFGPTTFETKETKWLTFEEFQKVGRGSHLGIVKSVYRNILK